MSQNPAREDEGTCNGDSGSPNYIDYWEDPNVIVSVTSSGDSFCRATNIGARVDTPAAVEFIDCVLTTEIEYLYECGEVEIMN
jgi:secreted trypsin-like serine protease